MYQVNETTPVAALSVAQFRELLKESTPRSVIQEQSEGKQYVYGLKGIRELFGVCHSTAQKLKHGVLAPAVSQYGRKLIIDREKAIELFNQNKEG